MGTKTSKYTAGSYYENAAKSVPWRIDTKERLIFVSPDDIKDAREHIFVQHLCSHEHGFHIQLELDASKRHEFNPKYKETITKEAKPMKYKILSTGRKIVLIKKAGNSFTFKYSDKDQEFVCGYEHIQQALKLGVWKEV